jgi:CRISPR-associated endonuclease/helicase Cas3
MTNRERLMMTRTEFNDCFQYLTENPPFDWQVRLFEGMKVGRIPDACDIPTGLGKTSVITIWALALGEYLLEAGNMRRIPLRLVYVVDRRVVVDQSTDEAETIIQKLQASLSSPESPSMLKAIAQEYAHAAFTQSDSLIALSSLRGQRADNREWCLDPSRPTIVVGTVDMIGSRLLFSGYGGVGKNHCSLQAGLLGQDTLIVIDEAHLSPSFVSTVTKIKESVHRYHLLRPFEVMLLSATIPLPVTQPGQPCPEVFAFDPVTENAEARRRLYAEKELQWLPIDIPDSAKSRQIRELTASKMVEKAIAYEGTGCSVIFFVSTVELVNAIGSALAEELGKDSERRILKMTGEMRGAQRDKMAEGEKFKRFLPSRDRETQLGTHYLIATSCAEVGANLDSDYGICDLSSLDSMIQRLGRINRFGKRCGDTRAIISIIVNQKVIEEMKLEIEKWEEEQKLLTESVTQAEKCLGSIKTQLQNAGKDKTLRKITNEADKKLKQARKYQNNLEEKRIEFCKRYKKEKDFSITQYYTWLTLNKLNKFGYGLNAAPASLRDLPKDPWAYPALPVVPFIDDARLDDWAMTSLKQMEYPRPLVEYWLRGVTEDDTRQTVFCWRADLNYADTPGQAVAMAQVIPVVPKEKATLATLRAVDILKTLAKSSQEKIIMLIDSGGEYRPQKLKDLPPDTKQLFALLAYGTVIIPSQCGGLD